MPRIISFDCGIITLAYSVLDIMPLNEIAQELRSINNDIALIDMSIKPAELYNKHNAIMQRVTKLTRSIIKIFDYEAGASVVGNGPKRPTEFQRIANIHAHMDEFHKRVPIETIDKILIEYQMKTNTTSPLVYYTLASYYTASGHADKLRSISANKKNKIVLGGRTNADFKEQYASAYYANKMHSVFNFDSYVSIMGESTRFEHLKCKRDLADTVNQGIAAWRS